jgi:protein-export membrane protein SecD
MLLGAMAWLNATLTLPGIAGIILTIGMGVDANVLIFERIKEELRGGRTPRSAVNAGYDRAWWTIIDSHVTTLITAFVLFQFGSGPIKGFAVSLSLGILLNLFTSLVGTKVAFDIQNDKFRLKSLSI